MNAVKKHPNQIDILMTDIKNFIETNIDLQEICQTLDKDAKTEISPYLHWIPDNKNNANITIKSKFIKWTKNGKNKN